MPIAPDKDGRPDPKKKKEKFDMTGYATQIGSNRGAKTGQLGNATGKGAHMGRFMASEGYAGGPALKKKAKIDMAKAAAARLREKRR